jgi:hypothetical protein
MTPTINRPTMTPTTKPSMASVPDTAEHKPILAERFKTKMCQNHTKTGVCPYEARCMFAHGDADLRTKEMNLQDNLVTEDAIKAFQRARALAERGGSTERRTRSRRSGCGTNTATSPSATGPLSPPSSPAVTDSAASPLPMLVSAEPKIAALRRRLVAEAAPLTPSAGTGERPSNGRHAPAALHPAGLETDDLSSTNSYMEVDIPIIPRATSPATDASSQQRRTPARAAVATTPSALAEPVHVPGLVALTTPLTLRYRHDPYSCVPAGRRAPQTPTLGMSLVDDAVSPSRTMTPGLPPAVSPLAAVMMRQPSVEYLNNSHSHVSPTCAPADFDHRSPATPHRVLLA